MFLYHEGGWGTLWELLIENAGLKQLQLERGGGPGETSIGQLTLVFSAF